MPRTWIRSSRQQRFGCDLQLHQPRLPSLGAGWRRCRHNLIAAAQAQQAVLVTLSNLYGYGPVGAPMTEQTPLSAHTRKGAVRAQMWHEALAAHEAGTDPSCRGARQRLHR